MTSKAVFVREATGFVRDISTFSAFVANLSFINIALGAITYTAAPYVFPGCDVVTATIIATAFSICGSFMYTLFTWAMPRSGGDYVLTSRVLHPVVGFVTSFNLNFWYLFAEGLATNWVTTLAIAPALLTIGTVTSNQSLINLANTISLPQYVTVIGLVIIIVTAMVLVGGNRATFLAIHLILWTSLVGVAVMIWLMGTTTHAAFVDAFNKFASYGGIISAAHAAGYSPTGPNPFIATLGVMPFVFGSTGYGIVTSYFAGEAKSIKKNAFYSQVLSTLIAGAILATLGGLAVTVFGYDFLGSISQLSYSGSSSYPFSFPPYLNLFVSFLTTNPALLWVLVLSFVAAQLLPIVPGYLISTRSIFAWSFDRVVPIKLSEVSGRFRIPIYAIAVVTVVEAIALLADTWGPAGTFLTLIGGALMALLFSLIVVAVAATVFPFKKKKLFEHTAADIRIAGIPLISIFGVISFCFYSLMAYFYLVNPLYGANAPIVFEAIAVVVVFPLVVYVCSYFYHKSQGIDLSLVFKELPPE